MNESTVQSAHTFKAEIKQLLDILIHSLYTEREIFLRELISNASDALSRMRFVMLTDQNVLDPQAELAIRVSGDPEKRLLVIEDSGVGMTAGELAENLGTIAHSGARAFLDAAQKGEAAPSLADIIGQFGVGFYSVFMVAEKVTVVSRSYRPDESAARWESQGGETYTLDSAEKTTRGTRIEIYLKEDATEFAQEHRLREIIRRHSDFVVYPIFLGDSEEPVNSRRALWREAPGQVTDEQYADFYKQFTLDFEPPLLHLHLRSDAPVQMYALLYIPASAERNMFSLRKEDGLKLYARKVLIQEYTRDLLPEYLRFVQGVVDSEDLPLNVSRETIQANPMIAQIRKILSGKVLGALREMAAKEPEKYARFWQVFGARLKEGVVTQTDAQERKKLYPLLRFGSTQFPAQWVSLADYVGRMKAWQKTIYYLLGEDADSVLQSPHLDPFRARGIEVLTLTEPIDSFLVVTLTEYEGFPVKNAASADLPDEAEQDASGDDEAAADAMQPVFERFRTILGERVAGVRFSRRLHDSVARLSDPDGAMDAEMQRVYRYLGKDYTIPKKVLELNPRHALIRKLAALPGDDPLTQAVVTQVYESALLLEGLHPNPAGMVARIQQLMDAALPPLPEER
ncbi:MAG: molecular chaperone HtpG [Anaerolineales bacterium]